MNTKVGIMMREVVYQVLYVIFILIVVYGNQDAKVFRQNKNMRNLFTDMPMHMVIFITNCNICSHSRDPEMVYIMFEYMS